MHWDNVGLVLTVAKTLQVGTKTATLHSPSTLELVGDDRRSMPCAIPQLRCTPFKFRRTDLSQVSRYRARLLLACSTLVFSKTSPFLSCGGTIELTINARTSFLLRFGIKHDHHTSSNASSGSDGLPCCCDNHVLLHALRICSESS
jgi:hypothetical protein